MAIPAPSTPPTSEWLLDTGIPKTEETKTHKTAPNMAAKTREGERSDESTIPLPIIFAIAVENKKGPIKLNMAASPTA